MHESDQIPPSHGGPSNASQDEHQGRGPEFTAPANLTPSSARPPPAHPILKKPRGPSNSGPRPTARFVDVPDSEEDTSVQSGSSQQSSMVSQADSSSKSRAAASRSRSPAKSDKKPAAGKKFVASSTASKRRPVLPRRQSSQSSIGSAGSDVGSRDGSMQNSRQGISQRSNSSSRDNSPARKQGNSGLSTQTEGQASKGKAPERRPTTESATEKRSTPKPSPQYNARIPNVSATRMTSSPLAQEPTVAETPVRPQNHTLVRTSDAQLHPANVPGKSVAGSYDRKSTSFKSQSSQLSAAGSEVISTPARAENGTIRPTNGTTQANQPETPVSTHNRADSNGAPPMTRSKSNNESKRASSSTAPTANFKSPSVVGMSSIAVAGGFDFETPRARLLEDELPVLGADQPDIRKPSVLDSRLAPTQPSAAPPPPMARSKSQLTLLLERDKARIGDKHKVAGSSSSQKGDGKNDSKKPH